MTTVESILKLCSVFSTLSNEELDKVASLVKEKEYEAGSVIFHEEDVADELLVVVEGRIALQLTSRSKDGQPSRRITVDIVDKHEMAGWSALVEPYKYTMTAVCLQKVKACVIKSVKLRGLIQDDCKIKAEILSGLVKVIALRLSDTRQLLISERLTVLK
jgi:CRP/FNR family cyclic AMP-dependent transcriptional regulator